MGCACELRNPPDAGRGDPDRLRPADLSIAQYEKILKLDRQPQEADKWFFKLVTSILWKQAV